MALSSYMNIPEVANLVAANARLRDVIRETEFVLTVAVIPDAHERCKIALEKLRAHLKD